MKNFYAFDNKNTVYLFPSPSARKAYCQEAPFVTPITREHYLYLTRNANKRGGAYSVIDKRGI